MRPARVLAGKIIDDKPLKLVGFVHNVVRHPQLVGHAARVRNGRRTAAFVLGAGNAVLRPDLHGYADDVKALLLEQVGSHTRIHPAAHAQKNALIG